MEAFGTALVAAISFLAGATQQVGSICAHVGGFGLEAALIGAVVKTCGG